MDEGIIYGLLCFTISFLTAYLVSKRITEKKPIENKKNSNKRN